MMLPHKFSHVPKGQQQEEGSSSIPDNSWTWSALREPGGMEMTEIYRKTSVSVHGASL